MVERHPESYYYLADYGLSRFIGDIEPIIVGDSLITKGEVCGTPRYMSPELKMANNKKKDN